MTNLKTLGILLAIAAVIIISGCSPKDYDSFAKCLTDNNVKMYGAYWCPHCAEQKEMFGDSWQYVTYIECSLPDGKGQTEECAQEDIKGYPLWEFGDGTRAAGRLEMKKLSELSGCSLE